MLIAERMKKPIHSVTEDETVIAVAGHMRDARIAFLLRPEDVLTPSDVDRYDDDARDNPSSASG